MWDISFCMQLSPYNYERIEAVLQILQAADENVTSFSVVQVRKEALFSLLVGDSSCKSIQHHLLCVVPQAMGLLQHLKSYKRISPTSDVENAYLLENGLRPNPLSNSRLPFHLLIQNKHYWKIICKFYQCD